MVISILGIGTELTSGQILNRNAHWISNKLKHLGFDCSCHVVVADHEKNIIDALTFCAERSDAIITTGGLGPTTDDFTRSVLAKWSQKKLIFDSHSWLQIENLLTNRGLPIREFQRQQAYFPEGSIIYKNALGTANAFRFQGNNKIIYCLPGPPKEIEGIWQNDLVHEFTSLSANLDPLITKSWDTIGLSESEIAFLAESALKDCPIEKGYRVHLPYVEVKLTYRKTQAEFSAPWVLKLDQVLSPYTQLRDTEDAAQLLCQKLTQFKRVLVIDEFTGVSILNRLFPFAKSLLATRSLDIATHAEGMNYNRYDLVLRLDLEKKVHINAKNTQLVSPFSTQLMQDREKLLFSELAILFWCKEL